MTDTGYREILALRRRLARIEEMATAAQAPVLTDRTPDFGDALRRIAHEGTASGPAIDALRRQITERPEPAPAPNPHQLAAATRRVVGDLSGSASIEAAYAQMQEADHRRTVIEEAAAGGLGYVDPLAPSTAKAIAKLDKLLKGQ